MPSLLKVSNRLCREILTKARELHGLCKCDGVKLDRTDDKLLGIALDWIDGARFGDPMCAFPGPRSKQLEAAE